MWYGKIAAKYEPEACQPVSGLSDQRSDESVNETGKTEKRGPAGFDVNMLFGRFGKGIKVMEKGTGKGFRQSDLNNYMRSHGLYDEWRKSKMSHNDAIMLLRVGQMLPEKAKRSAKRELLCQLIHGAV